MPGLLVAIILIASLLLVHFSLRKQPMPEGRPLDVDEGLPLPEAGQASTVFSLTALFGAYFGIALLLGLPALMGVAFGTALGFYLIRRWIDRYQPKRFEAFLFKILRGAKGNTSMYAFAILGIQCAFATSELLILREIAKVSIGVRPEQATLLAVGIAIIGYFYVLFGGYIAVFRTDVVQFFLVGGMAIIFSVFLFSPNLFGELAVGLFPRPGYWELPVGSTTWVLYSYHFCIGAIMGMGFLAASPDTWKRVFLVSKKYGKSNIRFLTLVIVGMMPFLMLIPFALSIGSIPDGEVNSGAMFSKLLNNDVLFVAAVLGLVASFLSSFNSALLASVQIGLLLKRKTTRVKSEMSRFHWLMVTAIFTIFFLFVGFNASGNPYLLANLLLGAYSIIGGVQIGTKGDISRLPENSLLWIYVLGGVGWLLYLVSTIGLPKVPTTYQINTVPGGVVFFLITTFICQMLSIGRRKNVRHY
jgi:hypothetical protein